jgi:hypothetical protein
MSTIPVPERQQDLERYVIRGAMSDILAQLVSTGAPVEPLFDFDTPIEMDFEAAAMEISGELWSALWPCDEELDSVEHNVTEARSLLLAATIFQRLAADPSWSAAVAEHLIGQANMRLPHVEAGGDA